MTLDHLGLLMLSIIAAALAYAAVAAAGEGR
jgi:hypothetical protein